ncbi:MAG TPA: hypothetical protein VGM87_05615 [Roseomonas sp.]|jgi:hypothetical protein
MVTKTVHYRKYEPAEKSHSTSFQQLIAQSLVRKTGAGSVGTDSKSRTFDYPGDMEFKWLIHNIVQTQDSIFGSLCLYSPELWMAVLRRVESSGGEETLEEALNEIEIAERPPEEGEEFLRGISFWLVIKNHVFVIQHVSLQTKAYEQYFAQLFEAAGTIPAGHQFALNAVFDRDVVGGDLDEIAAVEIGGIAPRLETDDSGERVPAQAPLAAGMVDEQKSLGHQKVSRWERAFEVLKAVFGTPNAEKIMDSIPADAELEVDVKFGYKTRKRKVSRRALKELADAARNLPDGEVRAIGKQGRQVGNDLRLSAPMPFKPVRPRSSLLQLDDAREKMLRVYHRFVEDSKIEA